jgi:hypothetical protein
LWLAHGRGSPLAAFLKRLAQICAGALVVTIGTYFAFGSSFVFFGILHTIAVSSVIGLAFLRLPPLLTLSRCVGRISRAAVSGQWPVRQHLVGLERTDDVSGLFCRFHPDISLAFAPVLAGIAVGKTHGRRRNYWLKLRSTHPPWNS